MGIILSNCVPFFSLFVGLSKFQRDERGREWFFFSRLQKKYPKGRQVKRATNTGFWKPTGTKRLIRRRATGERIGEWKTLVFHVKRGTEASSTGWVIHQYCTYIPLPDNVRYPSLTHCFCVNFTSFCFNQHCLVSQKITDA